GLQIARRISGADLDITLIDHYNFHQFQPLFSQVATGRLEPSSISIPLRKIFHRKENIHVRVNKIEQIDLNQQRVIPDACQYSYDSMVIATGCTTNFFGNGNIARPAYTMTSIAESISLSNRIFLNFEAALSCNENEPEGLMNIVIA